MGKERNKVEIFKLEDRVLFEAGAVVQAAEAAAADQANNDAAGEVSAAAEMQSEQTASNDLTPDQLAEMPVPPEMAGSSDAADMDAADTAAADPEADADVLAVIDSPIAAVSGTGERILVVVNSSVADSAKIVNDLGDNYEILRLEAGTDALDTINAYLDSHADTEYSALHIISHGSDGYITLNGEKIDNSTLNPADWKAIGEHLTDDADILIYGCDTAQSDEGKALVRTIADLTGADVAASTDSTGSDGDWDLEYRTGLIESATIQPAEYSGRLASEITVTIDGENDFAELQKAITDVEAGGIINFEISADYAANMDTNGDGTADSYGITITATLTIGKNITIEGWVDLDNDNTVDDGERIVFDGGKARKHLTISSGTSVTLDSLVIQNGASATAGGAAIDVSGNLTVTNSIFRNNNITGNVHGAVFNLAAEGITLNLTDSRILDSTTTWNGGAIIVNACNVTVNMNNAEISGITTGWTGGAVYTNKSGTVLNVTDSVITNNTMRGGTAKSDCGLFAFTGAADSKIVLRGSEISGNTATSGVGGVALRAYNSANVSVEIYDTEFANNSTVNSWGGAICIDGSSTGAMLLIEGATFTGNKSTNNAGGAVYVNASGASVTISGSTFSGNTAATNGGAVFLENGKLLTISDSIFSGNTAKITGGAINISSGTIGSIAALLIEDSVFMKNTATNGGGAVFTNLNNAVLSFRNSLFDANISARGGGIMLQSAWGNNGANSNYVDMIGLTVINNEATVCGGGILITNQNLVTIANSTIAGNIIRTDHKLGDYANSSNGNANITWGGAGIYTGSVDNAITGVGEDNGQGNHIYLLRNIMVDNYMITTGDDGETTAGTRTASDFYAGQNRHHNSSFTTYLWGNIYNAVGRLENGTKGSGNISYLTTAEIENVSGITGTDLFDSSAWDSSGKFVTDANGLIQVKDLSANAELNAAVNLAGYQLGSVLSGSHQDYRFTLDGTTWYNGTGTGSSAAATVYLTDKTGGMRLLYSTAGAAQYQPTVMWGVAAGDTVTKYYTAGDVRTQLESGSGEYYFAPIMQDFGNVTVNGSLILHGCNTESGLKINFTLADATDSVQVSGLTFSGTADISAGNMIFDSVLVTDADLNMTGGTTWFVNTTAYGNTAQWSMASGAVLNILSSTVHSNTGITGTGTINVLGSIVSETSLNGTVNARYSVFSSNQNLSSNATNVRNMKWQDIFGSELVWDGLTLKTPDAGTVSVLGAIAAYDVAAGTLFYSTTYNDPAGITPVWYSFTDDTETTPADTVAIIDTDALGNRRLSNQGTAAAGAYASLQEARRLVVTTADDTVNAYDFKISLREAIEYAKDLYKADSSGDYTITFADTLYTLVDGAYVEAGNVVSVKDKVAGYDSAYAVLSGEKIVINGAREGKENVIIDMVDSNSERTALRIIEVVGGALELYNLELHGTDTVTVSTNVDGALLRTSSSGTLIADHVIFAKANFNRANAQQGGAVFLQGGSATITNSIFRDNNSNKLGPAALGTRNHTGTITLTNVTFTGNKGPNVIDAEDASRIVGTDLTFKENAVTYSVIQMERGNTHEFYNMTITGNNGSSLQYVFETQHAGSFYADGLTITGVTVSKDLIRYENQGAHGGVIVNSLIAGNTIGGNIFYNLNDSGRQLVVVNSTIVDNKATNVFNAQNGTTISLNNIFFNNLSGAHQIGTASFHEAYAVKPADAAEAAALFTDYANGDYTLKSTGTAANGGTLAGRIGNDFYYVDKVSVTDTESGSTAERLMWVKYNGTVSAYAYDNTDKTLFGLTGGSVLTTDHLGKTRILGNDSFSAGAYALKTITVKFDVNGGAATSGGSVADILLIQDQEQAVTNGFTLTDSAGGTWVLKGFDTEASATGTVDYSAAADGSSVTLTADQVNALIAGDKDVTLYAIWEKVLTAKFWQVGQTAADLVTYSVYNGDQTVSWDIALPEIALTYGSYNKANGWFTTDNTAVEDANITVKNGDEFFAEISYSSTLNFEINGADTIGTTQLVLTAVALANATANPEEENTFTLPTITRGNDWDVIGWGNAADATETFVDGAASGAVITIPVASQTLYAVTSKTYTGTFHYSGDDGAEQTVEKSVTIYNTATGGDIEVATQADLADWTAEGWTTAAQDAGSANWKDNLLDSGAAAVTISANTDFYAVYSRGISLTYDLAGGGKWKDDAGADSTGTQYRHVTSNEATALPLVYDADDVVVDADNPAKFVGWSLDGAKVTSVTFTDTASRTVVATYRTEGLTVTLASDKTGAVTYGDGTITLTATTMADGTEQTSGITYTWYRNGEVVANQTGATLTLANANDSGTYTVYAENENYYGQSADGQVVTINQREITIVEGSITAFDKDYNGNDVAALDWSRVQFSGFATGDSAASLKLSITATGTFDNLNVQIDGSGKVIAQDVTIKNFVLNDASGNYRLTTQSMTATAIIRQVAVTVTIIGNTGTYTYSGSAHTVSGFSKVEFSDATKQYDLSKLGYNAAAGTFTGVTSTIKATNVNVDGTGNVIKYNMGLTEDSFTNTDTNFAVTVNVTDGWLQINKAKVNVTLKGNSDTLTYNGAEQSVEDFTFTVTGEAKDYYQKSDIDVTAIAKGTDVGTYSMELSGAKNKSNNFDVAFGTPANGTLTIKALDVTVKVKGNTATAIYDGKEHTASGYTLVGISSGLYKESDFSFSGASVSGTDVKYNFDDTLSWYELTLTESLFTNNNGNFNVTFVITEQGKLQIDQLAVTVTITGHNAEYKYDGTSHSVSGYDFKSSSDLYKQEYEYAVLKTGTANVSGTDAGEYKIVLDGNMHNTNGNFAVTFKATDGLLTITKRKVTLTSADDTKSYDNIPLTNDTVTVSGDGFIDGQGATYNVTGSQTEVGNSKNTFTYTLNDGTNAANYDITTVEGTLTITPAKLTITMTKADVITYGASPIAVGKGTGNDITVSVTGGIGGDATNSALADKISCQYYKVNSDGTETLLGTDGTEVPVNAGTYKVVATISGETSYEDATASLTFTIDKAVITVTADAQSIEYGDDFDGSKITYSGWKGNDDKNVLTEIATITSSYVAGNSTAGKVGIYDLVLEENAEAENYTFVYDRITDNELTVKAKTVTMTITGEQRYNGEQLSATHTLTGFGSETITATVTANSANVGVYNEESEYTVDKVEYANGAAEGNYNIIYNVTLTVNQHNSAELKWYTTDNKEVTDTAPATWKYDGNAHGLTAQLSALAEGDEFTVTYENGNTAINVGDTTYAVEAKSFAVKNRAGEDVTANYDLSHLSSRLTETFTITPRNVTIEANSASRAYNGEALTDSGYTVKGDGFVGKDSLATVTIEGSQLFVGSSANQVTAYTLTNNTDAGNYNISRADGTLTVTQASIAITVTANSDSKTYDGSALTNDGCSVTLGTLATGDSVTATVTGSITDYTEGGVANEISNIKVMHGDVDVTDNYEITPDDGLLTINKLALTLNGGLTTSKTYDGTMAAANDYTLANVVGSDDVTLTAEFAYNSADVKNANTISATKWYISGTKAHNYYLADYTDVAGTITARDLYVVAAAQTITYGQEADVKDYTITNWVAGEEQTDIGSMGIDDTARSGAGFLKADGTAYNFTDGDLTAGDNYKVNFTAAAITVNKLALEHDIVVETTKVYDGTTSVVYTGGLVSGGVLANDTVTLNAVLDYNSKDVADANTISATTWNISGADAANYDLAAFGTQQADITPRSVTVSGITAEDKNFDGKTEAVVDAAGAVISNVVAGDQLSISVSGEFESATGGNDKTVNLTVVLTGVDAGNYMFAADSQTTTTASIKSNSQTEATRQGAPGQSSNSTNMTNGVIMGGNAGGADSVNSSMISSTEAQRPGSESLLFATEYEELRKRYEASSVTVLAEDGRPEIPLSAIMQKLQKNMAKPEQVDIPCGEAPVSDHLDGEGHGHPDISAAFEDLADLLFTRIDFGVLEHKINQLTDDFDEAVKKWIAG